MSDPTAMAASHRETAGAISCRGFNCYQFIHNLKPHTLAVIGCWSLVVSKQFRGGTQPRSMLGWWLGGAGSLAACSKRSREHPGKQVNVFSGVAFFTSPFLSTLAPQWLCWPVRAPSHPCPPGISLHHTTGCPAWSCIWSYLWAFPGPDAPIKPPTHPHC